MKLKIGLEIHCPLDTTYKLFCNCKRNQESCGICRGEPGYYPLIPKEEVVSKYKTTLSLLSLDPLSNLYFQRKHYKYLDLPKGFQITTCRNNFLKSRIQDNKVYFVALEEDPASIKEILGLRKIDYKRCGNPLLEIVTNPSFETKEEVEEFYQELERDLELNELKSKKEPLRVDVNISLSQNTEDYPNPRIELKNLHSITNISKAIEYERKRITKRFKQRQSGYLRTIEKQDWDHTRSYTLEQKTEYSRPKNQYVFLREINLPCIEMNISKEISHKPVIPITYLEVSKKLDILGSGLSSEERTEIISKGWVTFLNENLTNEDNTEKIRAFITILKYASLNNYNSEEIKEVSQYYFKDPITTKTLKRIMISRDYSKFYEVKRKQITIEHLGDFIRPLSTIKEKIETICELEKEYILPTLSIPEITTL